MNVGDLIGKPFADGGRGPDEFDCWGLVKYIFHRERGIVLPDYAVSAFDPEGVDREVARDRGGWEDVTVASEWDLCLFSLDVLNQDFISHVGLHVGNGQFIHTVVGHNVSIGKLRGHYWAMRYKGAVRWRD